MPAAARSWPQQLWKGVCQVLTIDEEAFRVWFNDLPVVARGRVDYTKLRQEFVDGVKYTVDATTNELKRDPANA